MLGNELITLGIGNYGTLTAAHFINATTKYDQEHDILYMESRIKGASKVPRLLLLDNQQPAVIQKVIPLQNGQQVWDAPTLKLKLKDENNINFQHITVEDLEVEGFEDDDDDDDNNDDDDDDDEKKVKSGAKKQIFEATNIAQEEGEDEAIFRKEARVTPWARYIYVPLHERALMTMDHEHADPQGALSYHSFGYGFNALSKTQTVENFLDNIRYMLEAADHCQGFQYFVDADSAFGGLTQSLVTSVMDELGTGRMPQVCHAAFPYSTQLYSKKYVPLSSGKVPNSSPWDSLQPSSPGQNAAISTIEDLGLDPQQVAFLRKLQEETNLNRLLSTHFLSSCCPLYVPMEIPLWNGAQVTSNLDDDVCTAALVAAASDTALYACRQGAEKEANRCTLGSMCNILRPEPSMRIVSAFSSLASGFSFPNAEEQPELPDLWKFMSDNPLLNASTSLYSPLTHPVSKDCFGLDAGRVIGHNLCLRGFAHLSSQIYPTNECMWRYIAPLKTTNCHTLLVKEGYPCSDTFPVELCPQSALKKVKNSTGATQEEADDDAAKSVPTKSADSRMLPSSLPVAAHYVNTYASAPYIHRIVKNSEDVVKYQKPLHRGTYGYEDEEWREVLEGVFALRDDYDHDEVAKQDADGDFDDEA